MSDIEKLDCPDWPVCPFAQQADAQQTVSCCDILQQVLMMQSTEDQKKQRLTSDELTCRKSVDDLLKGLSVRFPIDDYITPKELDMVLNTIDCNDYFDRVYPDAPATSKSTFGPDYGIIPAIAKFKHTNQNPQLTAVSWECSALGSPVPRHLYCLTFKSAQGVSSRMNFRSGTEILTIA